MSDQTKYQEGVIILSDGTEVPFLCKALSSMLSEEQLENLAVEDIRFLPEADRTEELKEAVLKENFGNDIISDEDDLQEDASDDIEKGVGWDSAY